MILGMSSGARHRRLSPDETVQPGGSRGVNPAHHTVPVDFQDVAPKTRGVLQKIFLMIILGQIECFGGQNFSLDMAIEPPPRFLSRDLRLRCFGQPGLPLIVGKNCRFVLRAPGSTGWVVAVPEDVEQLLVGNLSRIKIELEGLGMVAETVIGWVQLFAAGVTDPGADHAFDTPKLGVWSPESTQGKGGRFEVRGCSSVDGRNGNSIFGQ